MSTDDDKAAILAVLAAETQAWLRRDMKALAENWVHSPQARRMSSVANHGAQVQIGWDAIFATLCQLAEQYPATYGEDRVRHENMNIVVNGDTAWVTYDQVADVGNDGFELAGTQHELKIFQRQDGRWKLFCIVVLQRAVDHETCPLIEVDQDKKVLWMNGEAHEQIGNHAVLVVSAGRLRARNRAFEADLKQAVTWANQHRHWHMPPSQPSRLARPVVLGELENASPQFCWVLLEDGKILVSFNDDRQVKRRLENARGIYGLTAAQAELAVLLAKGTDLAQAADQLGVSINTVRSHLQRLFDRTGARSQSALVSFLLNAEAPTGK